MVGIIDEGFMHFPIGSRIKVGHNAGTVKYVGEVKGYTGIWLGVEWDDAQRGKHNGSLDGKFYFMTDHATSGSFIRPSKLLPFQSLEEAARERYLITGSSTSSIVDQQLLQETQASLQAKLLEIVGMDKIARKQSRFEELMEISVDNTCVNTAGYLKDFAHLTTLNLSHTLVWNWEIVADILKQVPTLIFLDLSGNRLLLPTDAQVTELEPAFRNLQHLNLSRCGYKDWAHVMQTARLWPFILSLCLQDNAIAELKQVDCKQIFRNLRELDLHRTKLMDFDQVCKLGNISKLTSLNLMENGIEEIKLPDCDYDQKLNIFVALERLNLQHNPIWNEVDAFNELDKLPRLRYLSKTPHLKSDFDEMLSRAVATIGQLQVVNKAAILPEERRGAEYEMWKKYAIEWGLASKSPDALREFYKKHRSYAQIVKKYGPPTDFIPLANEKQVSKLITIRIKNKLTGEIWEKKVPRMISVQTLRGLIIKRFHLEHTMPRLVYQDAHQPDLIVPLENTNKTLDYYSLQDNDTVLVEW